MRNWYDCPTCGSGACVGIEARSTCPRVPEVALTPENRELLYHVPFDVDEERNMVELFWGYLDDMLTVAREQGRREERGLSSGKAASASVERLALIPLFATALKRRRG